MHEHDHILQAVAKAADAFTEACNQHGICVVYALTCEVADNTGRAVVSIAGKEAHLLPALSAIVQHFRGAYPIAKVTRAIQLGMQNTLQAEEDI